MVSFFAGSLVLITVTLKMLLHITHFTMPLILAVVVSMVGYLIVFIGLEVVGMLDSGVFSALHTLPFYYLGLLVIPIGCLLPDYVLAYVLRQYFPSDAQIIQEDQRLARMKQAAAGGSKNGKNVKGDLDDLEAMVEMQDSPSKRQNPPGGDEEEEDDDENEEEYEEEEEEEEDRQVEEYESTGRGVFNKKQREGRSQQIV